MMDKRNSRESGDRFAMRVRTAALIVVVGSLVAVWTPINHRAGTTPVAHATAAMAARPDMSVYFPDRFPAPQGPIEPLPSQF
jgi:hypothetical protein